VTSLPQAFVTSATLDGIDAALLGSATRWRVAPGSVTADR
jgi:hypothetical protein